MSDTFIDDDVIKSLREVFYAETLEHLDSSESAILILEQSWNDFYVQELQRALHNIKGSGRAVGLEPFCRVAHDLESALMSADFKRSHIGQFLEAVDLLRQAIGLLKSGERESAEALIINWTLKK